MPDKKPCPTCRGWDGYNDRCPTCGGKGHVESTTDLQRQLDELLVIYGGETVLRVLGKTLQTLEGAGNAAVVGKVIEDLAQLDW